MTKWRQSEDKDLQDKTEEVDATRGVAVQPLAYLNNVDDDCDPNDGIVITNITVITIHHHHLVPTQGSPSSFHSILFP